MRYIINDDDLEDWYVRLNKIRSNISAGENYAHGEIEYILSEIEREFTQHVSDENLDTFINLLKSRK